MSDPRLTVVQVLPALESGGVERGTLEVAEALVQRGHRSIVISGGGRLVEPLVAAGSEHVEWPIGKKSLLTLRLVRRLRRILSERNADILHARSRVPAWVAYLAWRKMDPATRPRFVTTVHGLYSVSRYSSVMTRGEKVIAISRTVRDYILQNYPRTPPHNIELIYRGVDAAQFPRGYRPDETWLAAWRKQFPQLEGRKLVTLPGRITRLKGHPVFVELMRRLVQRVPEAHGLIVGGEDPKRRRYAAEVRQRIADAGLSDRITFTGHRTDMREVYALSGVVVAVTSQPPEAFGRTTLEALCIGTPLVGYDQGGVGEILEAMLPQGRVPPGDVEAMAERVASFLADPPAVQPNTIFTLDNMLNRTIELYEQLAASRRAAAASEHAP